MKTITKIILSIISGVSSLGVCWGVGFVSIQFLFDDPYIDHFTTFFLGILILAIIFISSLPFYHLFFKNKS